MKIFVYCMREFDEKEFWEQFSKEFDCEYGYCTEYPNKDNLELARGYDAVSVTPCDMNGSVLNRFYDMGVRYVATRSIGFDHIDLKRAKELGMGVCHVSYAPETVADYAIMLMLMCCRNICHIMERAKVQDYTLKGKMEELYARSDIISLHTPSTADNYHLLNKTAFEQMKDGVTIINTARGALIDTEALIAALETGKIGHAALDVLENEDGLYYANRMGNVISNRDMAILRAFPNVILSPHTAFYTRKVVQDMAYKTIKGVYDMMNHNDNPLVIL